MDVDPPSQQPPVETAEAEIATAPTALTDPAPSGSGTTALEASHLDPELPQELVYAVTCKWKGASYELKIAEHDTVGDLKAVLWSLTGVPPERMKLVGLVKGKLPGDEEEVVKLGLGDAAPGKRKEFMMIGTPEGEEHKSVGPSVKDEADVDYAATEARKKAQQAAQSVRNRRKLKEAADALQIDQMAAPRPGKKLLVLDLDGCILDTTLWKEPNFSTQMFMRPYLHDFLRLISPYYDVVIWSQTSWRWLEQKLVELDVIGPSRKGDYHIVTTLSRDPMFSVYSEREGKPWKHEVKALGILWSKFPEYYSAANTVHVDDLSRNFALNPKNGIKVHAYKDALTRDHVSTDLELLHVARYLLQLVQVPDVTALDHSRFRKSKLPLPEGVEDPLNLAPQQQP
ncbi:hypothetical protein JCM1840_000546 [Sporobolomyces johnsonii]